MILSVRYIKLVMVGAIALFFSLIVFNNLIDPVTNFTFVQHVLSMDTTFHVPVLMQRAITNESVHKAAYYLIVIGELLTAIVCWIGCGRIMRNIRTTDMQFNKSKSTAFIGLLLGFIVYMVGFIIIGGEWFCMWQSSAWNAQSTAGLFSGLIMFVMIFLGLP